MKSLPLIRTQAGMTLIEVLVAILLFSFGLLGFVGLQARAIQYSTSAEDSNRASLLANEMATTLTVTASPTPSAAALTAWKARVADPSGVGLPSGDGDVTTVGNVATIKITWRPPSAASSAQANNYTTDVTVQ